MLNLFPAMTKLPFRSRHPSPNTLILPCGFNALTVAGPHPKASGTTVIKIIPHGPYRHLQKATPLCNFINSQKPNHHIRKFLSSLQCFQLSAAPTFSASISTRRRENLLALLLPHIMESLPYLLAFCMLLSSAAALATHWTPATATWYGSPEGDGSDGGACGYGSMVDVKPFRARVGAVSPVLFKGGEGCGACYKVRCLDRSICTRRAVTVIITDECPGGYCSNGRTHFDLSGAAFGRMAVAGNGGQLRNRGVIPIIFRR